VIVMRAPPWKIIPEDLPADLREAIAVANVLMNTVHLNHIA